MLQFRGNKIDTIRINGSYGEGGGQILRTSLALSMCSSKPVEIFNLRAGRKKPGLLRQHLTCARAAAEITNGQLNGDELGSQCLRFEPGDIQAGQYHFSIGSAGSTSLVLQTILPALIYADTSSTIILEGGTHNPMAPSLDFLNYAFFPVIRKMGVNVTHSLKTYGFYPVGGGKWTVDINPLEKLHTLDISERGNIESHHAEALVTNLPESIGERELATVKTHLQWDDNDLLLINADNSPGQGNTLSIFLQYSNICEVVTAFGQKGLRAEKVALNAIKEAKLYLQLDAPVGTHLADQLLIPMALAGGGRIRTVKPSSHTVTNIDVIQQLLDVSITSEKIDDGLWEIVVSS